MWERIAVCACPPDEKILERGRQIQQVGIKPKDALNLACTIESDCRYFITTDKSLLKKAGAISRLEIINPIDFIRREEESDGTDD